MSGLNKDEKVILRSREDYPLWRTQIINELRQADCIEAIDKESDPNFEDARAILISFGAENNDITFAALQRQHGDMKQLRSARTKGAGIIGQKVATQHSHLIKNKTATEMWKILEERFQDLSPLAVCHIVRQVQDLKMSQCKDAIDFCSTYQKAYDEAVNLTSDGSDLGVKGIEVIIQGHTLSNAGKDFQAVVTRYQDDWKNGNTSIEKLSPGYHQFSDELGDQ